MSHPGRLISSHENDELQKTAFERLLQEQTLLSTNKPWNLHILLVSRLPGVNSRKFARFAITRIGLLD